MPKLYAPRVLTLSLLLTSIAACQPDVTPTQVEGTKIATEDTASQPAVKIPIARDVEPAPAVAADTGPCRVALTPDAEKGLKGATNVLLGFASALENRNFNCAAEFWGNGQTLTSAADFERNYKNNRETSVEFGTGEIEGAAGSLYYEVPFTITGTRADGSAFAEKNTIILRRVNDVEGASAAQLRWHIVEMGPQR